MSSSLDRIVAWGLAAAFFLAAAGFLLLPQGSGIPFQEPVEISEADLDPSARFETLSDPPRTVVNGFERSCMDCHAIIDQEPHSKDLFQHGHIRLEHGLNTSCVNCHSERDRNKLTSRDDELISYAQVELLCAQCHGPVYRQWERGTHGKTLGFWDSSRGESKRLGCTECHDPHHPRFDAMSPLPGPNTLRMGEHEATGEHGHGDHKRNPLELIHPPDSGEAKKEH